MLVADLDIEETISALLKRTQSLGIRPIQSRILRHPNRDPGCLNGAAAMLRPYSQRSSRALVVFDRDGCGHRSGSREDIEREVETSLTRNGWNDDDVAAIVIAPELEAWVWSTSPVVDEVLGWHGRLPSLRNWLVSEGVIASRNEKPVDPKSAYRQALRQVGKRHSAALFAGIAQKVSTKGCRDHAFRKLIRVLQNWFRTT
ncbi:hypothetical protein [Maioricimonas sp. JC845]|uniref:methylation-associated defense system protein MAD4 n=1 Tax=Maioricimonas sp. JC845 TaxID=3232138 RepID=UPI00345A4912